MKFGVRSWLGFVLASLILLGIGVFSRYRPSKDSRPPQHVRNLGDQARDESAPVDSADQGNPKGAFKRETDSDSDGTGFPFAFRLTATERDRVKEGENACYRFLIGASHPDVSNHDAARRFYDLMAKYINERDYMGVLGALSCVCQARTRTSRWAERDELLPLINRQFMDLTSNKEIDPRIRCAAAQALALNFDSPDELTVLYSIVVDSPERFDLDLGSHVLDGLLPLVGHLGPRNKEASDFRSAYVPAVEQLLERMIREGGPSRSWASKAASVLADMANDLADPDILRNIPSLYVSGDEETKGVLLWMLNPTLSREIKRIFLEAADVPGDGELKSKAIARLAGYLDDAEIASTCENVLRTGAPLAGARILREVRDRLKEGRLAKAYARKLSILAQGNSDKEVSDLVEEIMKLASE